MLIFKPIKRIFLPENLENSRGGKFVGKFIKNERYE